MCQFFSSPNPPQKLIVGQNEASDPYRLMKNWYRCYTLPLVSLKSCFPSARSPKGAAPFTARCPPAPYYSPSQLFSHGGDSYLRGRHLPAEAHPSRPSTLIHPNSQLTPRALVDMTVREGRWRTRSTARAARKKFAASICPKLSPPRRHLVCQDGATGRKRASSDPQN